jgi:hypothetical protein
MNMGSLLFTEAILIVVSLYPFYLKKYKKERYRGFWKEIGEKTKTPTRALLYPLGFLIGGLLYMVFIQ